MMQAILRSMVFTLVMFSASPFSAEARDLPIHGGPGGAPFRDVCAAGQFLVGVSVRSGGWLDAIAPLCARFLADQVRFDKWQRGPRHGGTGGSPLLRDAACPSDRYLSGIQFAFTLHGDTGKINFVDSVEITCTPLGLDTREPTKVCLETGDGCKGRTFTDFPGGFKVLPPAHLECSGLEAATGLHGRTGSFVDALGLICGPKPAVVTASSSGSLLRRKRATAKNDVDIYDGPGGQFKIIGMMRKGTVSNVVYGKDGWVKLRRLYGSDIIGFVAEDHLTVTAAR